MWRGKMYNTKRADELGSPRPTPMPSVAPVPVRQFAASQGADPDLDEQLAPAATGGRIERASGGKVDNIEHLIGKLMASAKSAKRVTDKTTEPLLNMPDEHIVKALDVAQQAI